MPMRHLLSNLWNTSSTTQAFHSGPDYGVSLLPLHSRSCCEHNSNILIHLYLILDKLCDLLIENPQVQYAVESIPARVQEDYFRTPTHLPSKDTQTNVVTHPRSVPTGTRPKSCSPC